MTKEEENGTSIVRIQHEYGRFTKVSVAATADCQNTLIVACEAMRKAKYSSPVLAALSMSQTWQSGL